MVIGVAAMGLIKLSVCLLYWRIFGKAQMMRKFLIVWMFMNIAWTIGFVGFLLGQCGSHLLALFSATEHLTYCEKHPLAGYFCKSRLDCGYYFILPTKERQLTVSMY